MQRTEAFANPEVLVWARRMAGFEPEEVARKVAIKPERLKSWESGDLRPTLTQLRKLADIYKRPLAVFFLEKAPPDEAHPRDFRRFDPKDIEPLSPELRLAIRDAHARRRAAIELFEELEERPPEFSLVARLSDDPENVSIRLHKTLTDGTLPPAGDARTVFNFWRAAAERIGVLVFQAEDIDLAEMRGFSISERPLPAVVLNIKDAYAARSFSLLHELTHILLNRGGLCLLAESGPSTDMQRLEVFCNHVAGATMLPADRLVERLEIPQSVQQRIPDEVVQSLARRFGASPEAVLRRLVILDRVSVAFYQRKRREYLEQYERHRQEPRVGGFAPPHSMVVAKGGRLYTRLVLEAYDEQRITASDLSEYLGIRLKHLDRIRSAVHLEPQDNGGPS